MLGAITNATSCQFLYIQICFVSSTVKTIASRDKSILHECEILKSKHCDRIQELDWAYVLSNNQIVEANIQQSQTQVRF